MEQGRWARWRGCRKNDEGGSSVPSLPSRQLSLHWTKVHGVSLYRPGGSKDVQRRGYGLGEESGGKEKNKEGEGMGWSGKGECVRGRRVVVLWMVQRWEALEGE